MEIVDSHRENRENSTEGGGVRFGMQLSRFKGIERYRQNKVHGAHFPFFLRVFLSITRNYSEFIEANGSFLLAVWDLCISPSALNPLPRSSTANSVIL
jgi:hypothetical protein